MKALLILVFLINVNAKISKDNIKFSSGIAVKAQNALPEEEIIKSIRLKYLAINGQLKSLKKVITDAPGLSNEGGQITCYYKGKVLKKSVLELYGEMGQIKEEYYFDNDKLIFKFSIFKSYDKPMYIKGSKVKSITEDRFYLKDEKLIRWTKPNDKIVNFRSDEFKEKEKVLAEDLKRMKQFLNEKK